MSYTPNVQTFFDTYPQAKQAYADTRLYHLTHSRYVDQILRQGLHPQANLFPPEEGEFLQRMHDTYGRGSIHEADLIRDRIRKADFVYLSTESPAESLSGVLSYGIPERLAYLVLGMKSLSQKKRLSATERAYAQQAYESHYEQLVNDDARIVALEIDPLSPPVVMSRIGNIAVDGTLDETSAVWIGQNCDPWPYNIAVTDVEPEHVAVHSYTPLAVAHTLLGVGRAEQSWLSEIS